MGKDARVFSSTKIAAIGPATAEDLQQRGILADLVPKDAVSEALVAALAAQGMRGKRVLAPGAETRRDVLEAGLRELGAFLEAVPVYRTVKPSEAGERLKSELETGIDIVTFASSSSVTNLLDLIGHQADLLGGATIACIGPVTAKTAEDAGLRVDIVAQVSTIPGLVEAIKAHSLEKSRNRQL